jgi:hypothetical protein
MSPKRLEAYQREMAEYLDDEHVFSDSDDDEAKAAGEDVGSCGWIDIPALTGLVKKKTPHDCIASLRNNPQV